MWCARLPDGGTERYTYPSVQAAPLTCDSPSTIEDARGGTKHLRFSDAGLLVAYTDCSGSSTHYQYDRFGELLQVTDALGQRQRLERDAAGRVIAAIHPDGSREQYQHNSAGQIVHIALHGPQGSDTAGAGSAQAASHIDLAYDLWGRLISRVHGGLALQFEYDAAGRLSRLVNENGAQSRFAWDVMDRLVQEEGFDQRLQRYRWDAAGQLLEASDGNAAQQHCTRYRWDDAGQLSELTLPGHGTAEVPPDQITRQRFEWDAAGRLLAARALGAHDQLLSEALLTRDALGRITGETQRLYRVGKSGQPEIEFEHTIAHRLDALGNRQASQLQGVGQIEWLLYGSGHVHGLEHNGSALLDFERDSLHRETGRTLARPGGHRLNIQRRWDALGRLQTLASQGLQGQAQVPQVLIGQLSQRQYHYDALGQLTAVQTTQDTLRYGYDAAGRLRAMQQGQQQQHWSLDPAGNRLPQPLAPGQAPEVDWASQVHAHWQQQDFNLLGQGQASAPGQGAITKWPDNRIGFSEQAAWRYDECGNRVEQLKQDGQRQRLVYDGANRLIEVLLHDGRRSRYRYDALGRRLAQITEGASDGNLRYYGWDGDRLVHTEQLDAAQPEQRHITHTVYEPETFTPLVQLSTTGAQAKPQVLALMAQSQGGDENEDDNAQMVAMLDALPQDMRKALEQSLRHAMSEGIPEPLRALMPDQGQNTLQRLTGLREQLDKQEQNQQTEVTVRHYHCDHLGTPIALTDDKQNIVWAARLDPWGNVQEEFNPGHIEQSIRLPGQHHDKGTGLYYNRHRYYDPSIGAYINQDPIGFDGGENLYRYSKNIPNSSIDPLGLVAPIVVYMGIMALIGGTTGGAVSAAKQKFIDKKCDIDLKDVANSTVWGALGGAAMPVVGTTVLGATTVGGTAGLGQYVTGAAISGAPITASGAALNTGMGAIGGGIGGTFSRASWYGTSGTALPELALRQQIVKNIQANTTPQAIGQGAAGSLVGSTTEIPCVTCKPKCK